MRTLFSLMLAVVFLVGCHKKTEMGLTNPDLSSSLAAPKSVDEKLKPVNQRHRPPTLEEYLEDFAEIPVENDEAKESHAEEIDEEIDYVKVRRMVDERMQR